MHLFYLTEPSVVMNALDNAKHSGGTPVTVVNAATAHHPTVSTVTAVNAAAAVAAGEEHKSWWQLEEVKLEGILLCQTYSEAKSKDT